MERNEMIKANAELVIKTFAEQNLDYNQTSVEWIDGYIERNRSDWNKETAEGLINVLGSFLGECICRNFGGDWKETEYGLGVVLQKGGIAYPFNKVRKQIENGNESGDSIAGFYNSIPYIFNK